MDDGHHEREAIPRPTIIAANELVALVARTHTHTEINKLALRLGFEAEIPDDTSLGIEKKCDRLGCKVLARPDEVVATLDSTFTLAKAFVREALVFAREGSDDSRQAAFVRRLARDGYVVVWGEWGQPPYLRTALQHEVDLPAADDEVRSLLKHFRFGTALGTPGGGSTLGHFVLQSSSPLSGWTQSFIRPT